MENNEIQKNLEEEIAALNEAKKSAEKAAYAAAAINDVCQEDTKLQSAAADDAFVFTNASQKYQAEIQKREKLSMTLAVLQSMGIEIGDPISFSEKAEAVFEYESMSIRLRMVMKNQVKGDDRDFDFIIRHVISIITRSDKKARVNFSKAETVENYTADELKALVRFLTGQRGYAGLTAVAARHVDGVL